MINMKVVRGVLIGLLASTVSLGLIACSFSEMNPWGRGSWSISDQDAETTEMTTEGQDAGQSVNLNSDVAGTEISNIGSSTNDSVAGQTGATDSTATDNTATGTISTDTSATATPEPEPIYTKILGDVASGDFVEVASNQYVVDMSGIVIHDLKTFEAQLRDLPKLLYIDMCDCGLSNEQMEELMGLYPNIRFVWKIHMTCTNDQRTLNWTVRTDALAFSTLHAYASDPRLPNDQAQQLKYCVDMVALDFGHNAVHDVNFIKKMPNLHLLITVDNYNRVERKKFDDLSVLQYAPKMMYLEIFVGGITDLSFLQYTPEMIDLNISYNPISDATYLKNLPNIQRLILESTYISADDYEEIQELYPDAQVERIGSGSIDNGWRTHKRYHAMIDMFRKNYWNDNFRTPEELEELANSDLIIVDGIRYYGTSYRGQPDSTYSFEVVQNDVGRGVIPENDGETNFDALGALYTLDNGDGFVFVYNRSDDTYRYFYRNEVIARLLNKKLDEGGNVKSEYLLDYDEWFGTLGVNFE